MAAVMVISITVEKEKMLPQYNNIYNYRDPWAGKQY
jgi:hypothetical protein